MRRIDGPGDAQVGSCGSLAAYPLAATRPLYTAGAPQDPETCPWRSARSMTRSPADRGGARRDPRARDAALGTARGRRRSPGRRPRRGVARRRRQVRLVDASRPQGPEPRLPEPQPGTFLVGVALGEKAIAAAKAARRSRPSARWSSWQRRRSTRRAAGCATRWRRTTTSRWPGSWRRSSSRGEVAGPCRQPLRAVPSRAPGSSRIGRIGLEQAPQHLAHGPTLPRRLRGHAIPKRSRDAHGHPWGVLRAPGVQRGVDPSDVAQDADLHSPGAYVPAAARGCPRRH